MAETDLDATVRRADPDRWLSSRFIGDDAIRADVVALYAFDHELDRAARVTTNALTAEIRLVWWREAVDEIFSGGRVRGHPVAQALNGAVARHGLDRSHLETMIEGRIESLESPELSIDQAATWASATAGAAAELVARILDPRAPEGAASPAGEVWGLSVLAREKRIATTSARERILALTPRARDAGRRLEVSAFPAVAHAALARQALRGETSEMSKRLRLLWAVAAGRI